MKEVKKEKFGTRNSVLKNIFIENGVSFLSNIWIITCRRAINPDKNTRYLICIEGQINQDEIDVLLDKVKLNITIINVSFDEVKKEVTVINLRNQKESILSYNNFKDAIIKRTSCKFEASYARGSSESTPMSRFFRENMGKGFALTDIDFFITQKSLFIEEKGFTQGDEGYLGVGQCLSMKEVTNDIFQNIEFKILCIDNDDFYVADIDKININNKKNTASWGEMVVFKLDKINKIEFIKNLIE